MYNGTMLVTDSTTTFTVAHSKCSGTVVYGVCKRKCGVTVVYSVEMAAAQQ